MINTNYEEYDEEIYDIAENYGVDLEEAQEIQDIMDETGVDEDDALEILEAGGL